MDNGFPIDTLQMVEGMDLSELKAILAETEDNRITISRISLDDAWLKIAKAKSQSTFFGHIMINSNFIMSAMALTITTFHVI